MLQEQIFQLKLNCLQLAAGQLPTAQELYTWVTEEAVALEEAAKAKQEAITLVR